VKETPAVAGQLNRRKFIGQSTQQLLTAANRAEHTAIHTNTEPQNLDAILFP